LAYLILVTQGELSMLSADDRAINPAVVHFGRKVRVPLARPSDLHGLLIFVQSDPSLSVQRVGGLKFEVKADHGDWRGKN
jgi:hypothetical protein